MNVLPNVLNYLSLTFFTSAKQESNRKSDVSLAEKGAKIYHYARRKKKENKGHTSFVFTSFRQRDAQAVCWGAGQQPRLLE